jgi:hypothetical protein
VVIFHAPEAEAALISTEYTPGTLVAAPVSRTMDVDPSIKVTPEVATVTTLIISLWT